MIIFKVICDSLHLQHHRIWTTGLISTHYSTDIPADYGCTAYTVCFLLSGQAHVNVRILKLIAITLFCSVVFFPTFNSRFFFFSFTAFGFLSTLPVFHFLNLPFFLSSSLCENPVLCENGRHRAGAAQPQFLLYSNWSWQPPNIGGWGERGPESHYITPAKTFLSASGGALQSRRLLLFGVHHLFSDGHRLPAALELLYNS